MTRATLTQHVTVNAGAEVTAEYNSDFVGGHIMVYVGPRPYAPLQLVLSIEQAGLLMDSLAQALETADIASTA